MKRLLVAGLAVASFIGVGASSASAVPTSGESFELRCDTLGTIDIVTNPGHGLWTPGFVVGTNQRLIPYAFRFQFGEFVEEVIKPTPSSGRLDRCEFTVEDPEGTFQGIVWLSYTPG